MPAVLSSPAPVFTVDNQSKGHSSKMQESLSRTKLALALILGLNLLFWCGSRDIYERWEGVPPVPTRTGAITMTLGDVEFSYRILALTLQNLGDLGVDTTPLRDYNYKELNKWFFLLNDLDPASDHVPMIAAYYFGATRVPKDVAYVIDYLSAVGQVPVGEKWHWLAQAVYLAQHRMYDFDLALKLAYKLRNMPNSATFPQWAREMPAFVLAKKGDKQAAKELIENMLATDKNMLPEEINNLKATLINELGVDPKEVEQIIRMRGGGP
jgi:hypothetical protein